MYIFLTISISIGLSLTYISIWLYLYLSVYKLHHYLYLLDYFFRLYLSNYIYIHLTRYLWVLHQSNHICNYVFLFICLYIHLSICVILYIGWYFSISKVLCLHYPFSVHTGPMFYNHTINDRSLTGLHNILISFKHWMFYNCLPILIFPILFVVPHYFTVYEFQVFM